MNISGLETTMQKILPFLLLSLMTACSSPTNVCNSIVGPFGGGMCATNTQATDDPSDRSEDASIIVFGKDDYADTGVAETIGLDQTTTCGGGSEFCDEGEDILPYTYIDYTEIQTWYMCPTDGSPTFHGGEEVSGVVVMDDGAMLEGCYVLM